MRRAFLGSLCLLMLAATGTAAPPAAATGGGSKGDTKPAPARARDPMTTAPPTADAPPSADAKLAADGFALARTYCGRCHGEGGFQGSATFSVIDPAGLIDQGYVVVGNAGESYMWQRIETSQMPPAGQPIPSASEKETLKEWVAAGAPKPPRAERPFRDESALLTALRDDLKAAAASDRPYRRYFSLTHLYNNTEQVSDFDLRLYRAALAKSVASLTWAAEPVPPRAVDTEATLFVIDLRDLRWDDADWLAILRAYPYGLRFERSPDEALASLAAEVQKLSASPLPYVRGDWFAVSATRPPLYHRLLDLPATDKELEALLGVDFEADFAGDRLGRAGFAESGVSVSNRLVERHSSRHGYYWKSYDFKRSNGTGSLFQFPLGPTFDGNPFPDLAFSHDGGEIIFSLPSGLQGYLLIDGKGRRIDEGPIQVVRDLKETSGTPLVVNGVSCMHCHKDGMIAFRDSVRDGLGVFGDARKKALRLFPTHDEMAELVARDRDRYLAAAERAYGKFLRGEGEADKPLSDFPEPIGAITRFYGADVTLRVAACELGIADADRFTAALTNNPELRRLGVAPLANGRTIDRQVWENKEGLVSPMQESARAMDLGTPLVTLGGK
jgi:serine/threonine-protein kinase